MQRVGNNYLICKLVWRKVCDIKFAHHALLVADTAAGFRSASCAAPLQVNTLYYLIHFREMFHSSRAWRLKRGFSP